MGAGVALVQAVREQRALRRAGEPHRRPQAAMTGRGVPATSGRLGTVHAQPIDVPAALRAVRRLRGVSQRQLAELAGLPPSTVSRIEAGSTDPRLSTLAALLAAAGVELRPCVGDGPLTIDAKRDRLRDSTGRHLPAHWEVRSYTWLDGWWWFRNLPPNAKVAHSYWKRWGRSGPPDDALARRWQDAT
jgi:transcriptional regulator with XRE-family HTH domain